MKLNLKSLLPIGLIILAVMFVMKMMKGSKRCEGFSEQEKSNVDCNCNINENFTNEPVPESVEAHSSKVKKIFQKLKDVLKNF